MVETRADTSEALGMTQTRDERERVVSSASGTELSLLSHFIPMRWISPTHITEEAKKAGDLLKVTQLVSLGEGSTCLLTEPMPFRKPEFWDQAPKLHPHPHATSCPCPGSISPPASPHLWFPAGAPAGPPHQ